MSLFLAIVIIAGTSCAFAQDDDEQETTRPPVHMAIRQDIPPYVTDMATGGLEVEILNAVFDEIDYPVTFIQLPRIRMIQMFAAQRVDGVATQNIDVPAGGCVTDWYISHQNIGLSETSRQISFNTLSDMGNLSVISFDGAKQYLGPEFALQAKRSPRYIESSDQKMHISLLYFGYFDAAIGDEWILKLSQARIAEETGKYKELTTHYVMPATFYAARFQRDDICQEFNRGLATIRKNGIYQKIHQRYRTDIANRLARFRTISMTNQPQPQPSKPD